MKKRLLAILMAATMSLSLLAGCGSTASDEINRRFFVYG